MMNETISNESHDFSLQEKGFISAIATLLISCACASLCYLTRQRNSINNQSAANTYEQPIVSLVIDREQERPSNSAESPRAIEMSVRTPAAHFLQ